MGMKISEVSRIFDIPAETLRYIERQGLVHPERKDGSNYREYDMSTFTELFEYMKYRRMGLSVKSIVSYAESGDLDEFVGKLNAQAAELQKEIDASVMMKEYIHRYAAKMETLKNNIGMFWFEVRHAQQYIYIGTGENSSKTYHDTKLATAWRKQVPFVSLVLLFYSNPDVTNGWNRECVFSIDERYAQILDIPCDCSVHHAQQQLCLSTYIKASGADDIWTNANYACEYAKARGYRCMEPVAATFLSFSYDSSGDGRYLQIQIPVIKEK